MGDQPDTPTIDNYGYAVEPISVPIKHLVGEGWVPLIVELLERLAETEAEVNPDWRATQVKEKFGGLRFYTSGLTEQGNSAVNLAESRSYTICEVCGERGSLDESGYWLKTLCPEHRNERSGRAP